MKNLKKLKNWFFLEESGQGITEYALIILFVSIAVVIALTAMGKGTNSLFQKAADVFENINSPTNP